VSYLIHGESKRFAPDCVSSLPFRYKPYGDVRKEKEDNQQDFNKRHAGIMDCVKRLSRHEKPLGMEIIYAVTEESKADEPGYQKQNASDEASDKYPRKDFKVISKSKFRISHDGSSSWQGLRTLSQVIAANQMSKCQT
jgi:hypothetical protein